MRTQVSNESRTLGDLDEFVEKFLTDKKNFSKLFLATKKSFVHFWFRFRRWLKKFVFHSKGERERLNFKWNSIFRFPANYALVGVSERERERERGRREEGCKIMRERERDGEWRRVKLSSASMCVWVGGWMGERERENVYESASVCVGVFLHNSHPDYSQGGSSRSNWLAGSSLYALQFFPVVPQCQAAFSS